MMNYGNDLPTRTLLYPRISSIAPDNCTKRIHTWLPPFSERLVSESTVTFANSLDQANVENVRIFSPQASPSLVSPFGPNRELFCGYSMYREKRVLPCCHSGLFQHTGRKMAEKCFTILLQFFRKINDVWGTLKGF